MADMRWDTFADDVDARLDRLGLSFTAAVAKWPELNKAMLSRACNGKPLSVANYLLVCSLLGLNPYQYFRRDRKRRVTLRDIAKRYGNQPVTAVDARETGAAR